MSHLDHIVRLKEELYNLGIKCPVKQQELTQEAYFRAMIRFHFKQSRVLGINSEEMSRIKVQLDKWNRVSPVQAVAISHNLIRFINNLAGTMANKGTMPVEEPSIVLESGEERCLCGLVSFQDLVDYLVKEATNCDE